jgi:cell division GTPase FtsZ
MRSLLIGCGDAGSFLVDTLMHIQDRSNDGKKPYFDALVLNTADTDLQKVKNIKVEDKMLIGAGTTIAGGHGAGGEPRVGAMAASADYWKIAAKIENKMADINRNSEMEGDIDSFIIFSGLGGGSGSGMAPIIANLLKENYLAENYPVLGVCVLPSDTEGDLYSYNAYIVLQSLLNESNLDGIILSYLGGKFLDINLNTKEFYQNFDHEVGKVLYMLMATGIGGSKTIDSSDILNTIKDGGGICTIGHVSANLNLKQKSSNAFMAALESNMQKPEGSEKDGNKTSGTLKGLDARILKKLVSRSVNKNNLLCPADFTKSKSGLILFKPDKDYPISRVAQEEALQWLQSNIEGVVRIGDIDYEKFKIKLDPTSNEIKKIADIELMENTTLEVITLLSGLSDISILKKIETRAKRVTKITQVPLGKRLLLNTFGSHESDNSLMIPCSDYRKREEVQIQEKIYETAINLCRDELKDIVFTAHRDKIKNRITVVDVKPVPNPSSICWSDLKGSKQSQITPSCFEVLLTYNDETDGTFLRRKYILKAEKEEEIDREIGKKIRIRNVEVLDVKNNWKPIEKIAIEVVLNRVPEINTKEEGWKNLYVSGIRNYPNCARLYPDSQCYEVKVINLDLLNGEKYKVKKNGDFSPEFVHGMQESLSVNRCFGEHTKYIKYYYYINSVPRPEVLTCEEMNRLVYSENSEKLDIFTCDSKDNSIFKENVEKSKKSLTIAEKMRLSNYSEEGVMVFEKADINKKDSEINKEKTHHQKRIHRRGNKWYYGNKIENDLKNNEMNYIFCIKNIGSKTTSYSIDVKSEFDCYISDEKNKNNTIITLDSGKTKEINVKVHYLPEKLDEVLKDQNTNIFSNEIILKATSLTSPEITDSEKITVTVIDDDMGDESIKNNVEKINEFSEKYNIIFTPQQIADSLKIPVDKVQNVLNIINYNPSLEMEVE